MSPWNSAAVPRPTMTMTTSCWQRKISPRNSWNANTMTTMLGRSTTCPPFRACLDLHPRHQPTLTSNRNRNQLLNRPPRSRSHLEVSGHALGSEADEVAAGVGLAPCRHHYHAAESAAAAAPPRPEPVSAPSLLLLPSRPRPRALITPPLLRVRVAPHPRSTAPRPLTQGSVRPISAPDEEASELDRTKPSSSRCVPSWQVRRCGGRLLQRRGATRWLLLPRRERVGRPRPLLQRLGVTLLHLLARSDPSSPRRQNHHQAAPPGPRNPNSRNRNRCTLRGSPRPARSG